MSSVRGQGDVESDEGIVAGTGYDREFQYA